MNYRNIIERPISKILLYAFIIFFLPSSILGQDYRLYPTGLLPPTEEEKRLMEKEWKKIDAVRPNEIAIGRINKQRRETNLPELNKEEVELVWQDNIDALKRKSGLDRHLLPEYLSSVDNSILPAFPPIRSQESFPSCAPFSVTYYQLTHMAGLIEGWNNKNEDNSTKFSPKWSYNFLNKGELYGVSWYTTYNLLEKHGAVTWEEFPYIGLTGDPKNYREWCLDTEAWENALQYRTNPVEYIYLDTVPGFEHFKQMITNGYVGIFGTYIYSWQYTNIKDDPSTPDDDEFVGERVCYWLKGASGAHSMTVVGYNDTIWIDVNGNDIIDSGEKGAFRVANSWGKFWEDDGFAWVAYDALYSTSKVSGAPSDDRWMVFMNTKVMFLSLKEFYQPSIIAKFTVSHVKRSQMGTMLGMSDESTHIPTSIWTPGAIFFQGGEFAFDGTTTATDGIFVLDFTDLINAHGKFGNALYLSVEDNVIGDAATVKDVRVIDYESGGLSYISHEVPQDVDAESKLWRILTEPVANDLLYTPVTPCRIVDTRKTSAGIIGVSAQRSFSVHGSGETISTQGGNPSGCLSPMGDPLAAHINMIAVNPTGKGNLQAFPVGAGTGTGLSVNYNTIDTNLANAGTVKTVTASGPDITVASNFSSAHVVIDVLGYYYPDGELLYSAVSPCRIVDTRNTSEGIIGASTQRDFSVHGSSGTISAQGGNPYGCFSPLGEPLAAHINMVAVDPTGKGNLQAFPLGAGPGAGLSVNYSTIDTNLANAGTVKAITGTGPDITVASNFSSAHTVIDVLGYYYPAGDLLYAPVTPCRIVDTRKTSAGIIDASTERNFRVSGDSSIISSQGGNLSGCSSPLGEPLSSAHINMVAVNPTGKGNLQAFPVGVITGSGLSVNYNTIGTNLANAGTVKTITGMGADITVASNFSSAHTVIDVLGYYYPVP